MLPDVCYLKRHDGSLHAAQANASWRVSLNFLFSFLSHASSFPTHFSFPCFLFSFEYTVARPRLPLCYLLANVARINQPPHSTSALLLPLGKQGKMARGVVHRHGRPQTVYLSFAFLSSRFASSCISCKACMHSQHPWSN
jgi:hypothetical protein